MRFRLPNTTQQGGQDLAGGVGNFFRALAMAPLYEAQAADEHQSAEDKRRLTQSQIGLHDSQIGKHVAEAAIKNSELQQLQQRPDMIKLMAASRGGVSVPDLDAAISERTNGAPMVGPSFLSAPIAGMGPSGRTANLDDVISTLFAPAMASPANHTNWDQMAQARGHYQDQGVLDQAAAAANGGDYMRSSALSAVRGKKEFTPFKAVGNTGTALNEVTGVQPVTNTAMNTLFDNEGKALIGQRNAAAGASGAQAGASTALRDLRKTQTLNEKVEGGIKALDYDAAKAGEPLPSSNKAGRGADSTNAKFRNQVIMAAMKKPEFGAMNQAEKHEYINTELAVAGLDPVDPTELSKLPAVTGAGRGGAKSGPIDAKAATTKAPDMKSAEAVRAEFKAGRLTREQAKTKLRELGLE